MIQNKPANYHKKVLNWLDNTYIYQPQFFFQKVKKNIVLLLLYNMYLFL